EVDELVGSVLAGAIDGALFQLLWDSSGGNALFLRELVRDGVQSGVLRPDGEVWRWHGPIEPGTRLQDLVALHMGRLDAHDRPSVELLAVGGSLSSASLKAL